MQQPDQQNMTPTKSITKIFPTHVLKKKNPFLSIQASTSQVVNSSVYTQSIINRQNTWCIRQVYIAWFFLSF